MNLIKKIQENIFRYELFPRGAKIIIGISGGPDSVCLLNALHELKNKYGLEIVIAHVNYGLRGKDSGLDEKSVSDLAKKYSLPVEILRNTKYPSASSREASRAGEIRNTNLEEKLRNIRYAFFEKMAKKHKASIIAVGHNLNDQAETVLMRILRGTGLKGLGAIKFRNKNIIRPLLNIPRKEIIAYLRKNKIAYRTDKTNLMSDFTRNKIRNWLLPRLEKEYNHNIQTTLYKLSQSVAEDYDFIHLSAKKWLRKNKSLSILKLKKLHPSLQHEILRQKIEESVPALREIESAHIDEILKIVESRKNKRQKITFKGLKIEKIGDNLIIKKANS